MCFRLKVAFLVLALAFCVKSTATAEPIIMVGDKVTLSAGPAPGTTGGGEFTLLVDGTNGIWDFITFCLEMSVNVTLGTVYTVDAVSPNLSQETAFLYTMFRNGFLEGYDYANSTVPGRSASADALQNAIWMFEGQLTKDSSNSFVMLADKAVTSGAWSGLGAVRVLNLAGAQDQLVLAEPASMTLLGMGLLGLARSVHRRRKVADV